MSKQKDRYILQHGISDERVEHDYYSTPSFLTEYLLERETFSQNILEPCVGGGAIADTLTEHGYKVTGIDIIDRGYENTIVQDFLKYDEKFDGDIITNPPYKIQLEFVKQCLKVGRKVALLLKLSFLETINRYDKLHKLNNPDRVYVFVKRVSCYKNNNMIDTDSGAFAFCWFVWDNIDKSHDTYVYWIPNHEQ